MTEEFHKLEDAADADRLGAADERRFREHFPRDKDAGPPLLNRCRDTGEHARHRFHLPIQSEFPDIGIAPRFPLRNERETGQNSRGDREVKGGSGLPNARRRQVDRDLLRRQGNAGVAQCCPDALLRLAHGLRKIADEDKPRKAAGDIRLHRHPVGIRPADAIALHVCNQIASFPVLQAQGAAAQPLQQKVRIRREYC